MYSCEAIGVVGATHHKMYILVIWHSPSRSYVAISCSVLNYQNVRCSYRAHLMLMNS